MRPSQFSFALKTAVLCTPALLAAAAWGQDPPEQGPPKDIFDPNQPLELCGTHIKWAAEHPQEGDGGIAGTCPLQGSCDNPAVRDTYIPTGATPIKTIRVRFHVFANTDGTNPASSVAEVNSQVAKMNADFLPHRIQFTHTTEIINNSTYRSFNPTTEEAAMKNTYADSPATQCNVYVVHTECCYAGLGTFPWDANALTNQGGIIIDDDWFDATNEVMTHEMGHCLGLWHTHHGVSEVDVCGACYENPISSNTEGDFCMDTPATPVEALGDCDGTGGTSPCSGGAWGEQAENYMGYAGPTCWSLFTAHQAGRMHCWITAEMSSWLEAPPPPCPGTQGCYVAHGPPNSPGCSNEVCCNAVCAVDPFCCNTNWDSVCASRALDICATCGGSGTESCYVVHNTRACNNDACCDYVCSIDSFCCNTNWDSLCVSRAQEHCNTCGGAGAGDCYVVDSYPKCNNASCCNEICAMDPYCCDTGWDSLCVNEALDFCDVTVIAGPITNPANGNHYYLLSKGSWHNCAAAATSLGGSLVTINNAAENAWVRANLANHGGTPREIWIGYNDEGFEGFFQWHSGQSPGYTNWNGGEPNDYFGEDYAEMYPTGGVWNDHNRYGGQNNFAVAEIEVLGKCGDILAANCFVAHSTPYCSDPDCCAEVCAVDSYCCNVQWDSICVDRAQNMCAGCGEAAAGSCYTSHGTTGCNYAPCCQMICDLDVYCCETAWDTLCANEAEDLCGCPADIAPPTGGDGVVNVKDLLAVIASWGPCVDCPADLVPPGNNGVVNVQDLLKVIASWGACVQCASPFTCGGPAPTPCAGSGPDCACFHKFHGGTACVPPSTSCAGAAPCPDGNCPPGFECIINSCCGGPICAPTCGPTLTPPEPPAPGTLTVSGIVPDRDGGGDKQ